MQLPQQVSEQGSENDVTLIKFVTIECILKYQSIKVFKNFLFLFLFLCL